MALLDRHLDRSAPSAPRGTGPPRPLRLALAGGGTGGHVVPGRHLLEHLGGRRALDSLLWFGAGRAAEERALQGVRRLLDGEVSFRKLDLPLESSAGGAPRWRDLAVRVAPATRLARQALLEEAPDVVCGLGGFTSLPVVLAARSLKLPTALLEINAVQGKATRWLSPIVQRVLHAWPSTMPGRRPGPGPEAAGKPGKHRLVGPPLGPSFCAGALGESERRAALDELGLDPERPLLVVLGGSQGAASLNRFLRERAQDLVRCGLSVVHQVGPGRSGEAAEEVEFYRAVEFVDDMARLLRLANLVLCRGGASTLAEVAAAGTPAVVVPYPHHRDGHQRANALALGEGAVVVEESAGADALERSVLDLAANRARLEASARALRQVVPRDGAARLFEQLGLLLAERVSHD